MNRRRYSNQKNRGNGRGRFNHHHTQYSINKTYDSAGPAGKVRGTAQIIYDKYLTLARDAQLSGDRVLAENFQQHAEHYLRIIHMIQDHMNKEKSNLEAEENANKPSLENVEANPQIITESQDSENEEMTPKIVKRRAPVRRRVRKSNTEETQEVTNKTEETLGGSEESQES